MNLRPYQQRAKEGIFQAWRAHRSTLLVMATGVGKTIVFAHVIKDVLPKRAMVLAHRDELIVQAKNKIQDVTGLGVEIEKAELYASHSLFSRMPIVVSSIQTQISGRVDNRRYRRFRPEDFGLLICDEAHHSVSKSWIEVINYYRRNPELKVLGVTATPDRGDSEALGQVFESVAFDYGILDAIQDGWLVDITQQFVPVSGLDFSHVRTTAGDLNEGDLSKVLELEENVQGICQPTLEAIHGLPPHTLDQVPVDRWREHLAAHERRPRRTIIFTVSVAQAELCCNVFRRAMDGVDWVCGATNRDVRKRILDNFSRGETHVVVNCGVLLEGFDNPAVELIAMARPTKSRALYAQAVGRSTRPLPGIVDGIESAEDRRKAIANSTKPYCRILDFVGNSGRHKLVSCMDILGGHVTEKAREWAIAKAQDEGKPVRVLVSLSNAQLELERQRRAELERKRQAEAERRAHLLARSQYRIEDVDPFGERGPMPLLRVSRDGRTFSEKQAAVLRKGGCDPNRLTYKQGQAIIGKFLSTPSEKQISVLKRFGYDPTGWDRTKACQVLDELAKSNWRRLAASKASESNEPVAKLLE